MIGGGGGASWDMKECVIWLLLRPVCSPVEKKSVQEIRTAGEALGGVLKQAKHYPALNLSRCFYSYFQEYSFECRQYPQYLKTTLH